MIIERKLRYSIIQHSPISTYMLNIHSSYSSGCVRRLRL